MARLKFWTTEPPGGWRYYQKETLLTIKETSGDLLVEKVIEHRQMRGLLPTDKESVRLDVERQICTRLNKFECLPEGSSDDWVPVPDHDAGAFNMETMMGFTKTMLEWISGGREVVSEEEMNRRAEICRSCPLNQPAPGCGSCSLLYRMVNSVIKDARKPEGLHVCGVCHCSLPAKVQLPREALEAGHKGRDLKFPVFCWNHPDHAGADSRPKM